MTNKLELIKERYEKIIKGEITKRLHYFGELEELKSQIEEEINEGNNRITTWALMIKNFFKIDERYELLTKEIFKDFEAIILEFYTELNKASSDSDLVESYGDEIGSLTSDVESLNEENAKLLETIKEKEEEIEKFKKLLIEKNDKKNLKEFIKVDEDVKIEPKIKTPISGVVISEMNKDEHSIDDTNKEEEEPIDEKVYKLTDKHKEYLTNKVKKRIDEYNKLYNQKPEDLSEHKLKLIFILNSIMNLGGKKSLVKNTEKREVIKDLLKRYSMGTLEDWDKKYGFISKVKLIQIKKMEKIIYEFKCDVCGEISKSSKKDLKYCRKCGKLLKQEREEDGKTKWKEKQMEENKNAMDKEV